MKKIKVSKRVIKEAQNIIDGVYAPLKGFVNQDDFIRILEKLRLSNGEIWPMPIMLDVNERIAREIRGEKEIILQSDSGEMHVKLKKPEIFKYKKEYTKWYFEWQRQDFIPEKKK